MHILVGFAGAAADALTFLKDGKENLDKLKATYKGRGLNLRKIGTDRIRVG